MKLVNMIFSNFKAGRDHFPSKEDIQDYQSSEQKAGDAISREESQVHAAKIMRLDYGMLISQQEQENRKRRPVNEPKYRILLHE